MSNITATAKTGFVHGKNYRKGDTVHASPEVIKDLEKAGLVEKGSADKAAPVPSNKKAPEPENKGKK